ncbi:hypothetical protein SRHO_G00000530 [Serrasalmus rhombeus]
MEVYVRSRGKTASPQRGKETAMHKRLSAAPQSSVEEDEEDEEEHRRGREANSSGIKDAIVVLELWSSGALELRVCRKSDLMTEQDQMLQFIISHEALQDQNAVSTRSDAETPSLLSIIAQITSTDRNPPSHRNAANSRTQP